ncbi:MAG: hypothetical protein IJ306_03765 [Oscillospiraceae bacterium]|nr:hypothetical protein [Oscillospiraceae bacterium]
MALEKITENDLLGKGVMGQPEVPGLTALEMQAAIEQITREVVIPKINEIIEQAASKEDLEKLLIEAGAVTSVFGRAGNVRARKGDYTPEMVGAAAKTHAREHAWDGSDPIDPVNISAADRVHKHGNITNEGKIGDANGMVLMTGLGGAIEAKEKANCGFVLPPERKEISGEFTAEDNKIYFGEGISDFVFNCDADKAASCHGWVVFGVPGTISLNGFDFIDDMDDIASAESGSRWEFDLSYGCLIIRKRSE